MKIPPNMAVRAEALIFEFHSSVCSPALQEACNHHDKGNGQQDMEITAQRVTAHQPQGLQDD
jgi:hypothetical protein